MAQVQDFLAKLRRESEERDAQRRAQKFGIKYLDVSTAPVKLEAFTLIPEERARQLIVAPFQLKGKELGVAVFDPQKPELKKLTAELQAQGYKIDIFITSKTSIEKLWGAYKFVPQPTEEITGKVQIEKERLESLHKTLTSLTKIKDAILNFDFQKFQIGELLEIILAGALSNRVSDIHFETEEKGVRLRYRIDGLLNDVVPDISKEIYDYLLSRIKLLSRLKLNVQEESQDGRFTIDLEKKNIELRVSIIPSEYGETVVIRILDPDSIKLNLFQLGLRKDDQAIIENQLKTPNGMILNTGPTGSGKTTTLYAFLLHKRTPEIKIITIEDPIEYHLEDIEQTQVDPEAGYTFANGLRSIMRQDPDVILVGEIRDAETSDIAIQASLTGHLVFSTVHANSATGAIPRLLDLKVKPTSIGPALNLIIAQRLVRKLCARCRIPEKISPEFKKNIERLLRKLPARVDKNEFSKIQLFVKKGCEQCGGSGYKGRIAIFELLEVNDALESIVSKTVTEVEIKNQAKKQGMITMQEDGILKTISGVTTLEEVESVTGPIKW